jgi:hypothetical protein
MPHLLLYSVNPYLKYYIHQKYRGDMHFVWCSEYFDSRKVGAYSGGSVIPPSSNPASLYKQLKDAAESEDEGHLKIIQQKNILKSFAVDWEKAGQITGFEREEIIDSIDGGRFNQWRPLIYLIPRVLVDSRLISVPRPRRASLGMEYQIHDLKGSEFEIIQP